MNFLNKADPYNTKGQQDIFIFYIEKLLEMYRIIYVSSREGSRLKQIKQSLANDLKIYEKEYP